MRFFFSLVPIMIINEFTLENINWNWVLWGEGGSSDAKMTL